MTTTTIVTRRLKLENGQTLIDENGRPAPIDVRAFARVSVQVVMLGNTAIGSGAFKLQSLLGGVASDLSVTATFASGTLFRRGLDVRDDAELDAAVTTAASGAEALLTFHLHDIPS